MLAIVAFNFAGNTPREPRKLYRLPKELEDVGRGTLVVVEHNCYVEPNGERLGVVVRLLEENTLKYRYSGYPNVIKKAHKNKLINIVKRRYKELGEVNITNGVYKKYRREFKGNSDKTKAEIRMALIKNMILAGERTRELQNSALRFKVFTYGSMNIVFIDNHVIDVIALNKEPDYHRKMNWVKPVSLYEVAVEYVEKLDMQCLKSKELLKNL